MPNPVAAALATTLGIAAALGFLLALTVNALTYASINLPARVPVAGPVHFGAIVVGAAVLLALSGLRGSEARWSVWPPWLRGALVASGLYAALNVALHYYGTGPAAPGLDRTRTLSSIWMALYLGVALYLLAAPTAQEG
jgi:hypothetical protein